MSFIEEVEANPLTLAQAAKQIPGRVRNPSTLWRWARHGKRINGHQINLEVLEVGRELLTSRPALYRFFEKCTKARELTISESNVIGEHASAEADLDSLNI